MLGLLLLRHYNARALTWPPLLWWETGLFLLLIAFSLSTAGPLFQPWAAEILQKGGRRSIREVLYLFPGAGPLFQPWAAEILQKGAPQLDLNVASISALTCFFFGAGKVHCFFARGSRCATTMQGLELDLRFCEGKPDCFFCWSASPYLPLDPFPAVSGRDPLKRGAATWRQMWCHLVLLSAFATHRGCTTVSSLGSCPLCLSACQGCFLLADPFPETLFGISFAEHTFHTRLA